MPARVCTIVAAPTAAPDAFRLAPAANRRRQLRADTGIVIACGKP